MIKSHLDLVLLDVDAVYIKFICAFTCTTSVSSQDGVESLSAATIPATYGAYAQDYALCGALAVGASDEVGLEEAGTSD